MEQLNHLQKLVFCSKARKCSAATEFSFHVLLPHNGVNLVLKSHLNIQIPATLFNLEAIFLELVSKELNHLAAILHVYVGGKDREGLRLFARVPSAIDLL